MNAALDIRDLDKRYGDFAALRQVTLALAAGERLALLGHNGAGKTTLMKMVLGVARPTGGGITVLGAKPGQRAGSVGFLPENVSFHTAMTGRETLTFYARLKRRPTTEVDSLLERVGLSGAAGRRVATYSKGMRQRLGLAQALLGHPRLLLLDEPTSGLDPALRQRFYEIVTELAAGGAAVLLSSHLLTELEERTDRIAIMDCGRLVVAGTLDALRRQAALPVRIRVRPAEGATSQVIERLGTLDLRVGADTKMAALGRVVELGPLVADVEVDPPGLDEVYTHFVGVESEA